MAQPPDASEPGTGRRRRPLAAAKRKTASRKKTTAKKRKTGSRRPPAKPVELTVTAGVERDLAAIAARDKTLAESGLATVARALAREIDDRSNSATSKSMCAKALQDVLEQLRELAPPEEARDGVDDIIERHRGAHLRAV